LGGAGHKATVDVGRVGVRASGCLTAGNADGRNANDANFSIARTAMAIARRPALPAKSLVRHHQARTS
jgi:hypothetical protein